MSKAVSDRKEELIAVFGLFLVAVFWGFGFVSLDICSIFPPFMLNAIRFIMATIILSLVFFKKILLIDKSLIRIALIAGIFIFLTYICATIGIRYTTPSRNAFFTCMEAMCVPIINLIVFRIFPEKKNIFCVFLCLIGIFFISSGSRNEGMGLNIGDVISFFGSLFYAAELIVINRYSKEHDAIAFTIVQMSVVAVLALIFSLITGEKLPEDIPLISIGHLVYLGVVASGIAFVMQTYFLKHISSAKGSLVLTSEPVIGAGFSAFFLKDFLGINGYIGGVLIFLAIVISESEINFIRKKGDMV